MCLSLSDKYRMTLREEERLALIDILDSYDYLGDGPEFEAFVRLAKRLRRRLGGLPDKSRLGKRNIGWAIDRLKKPRRHLG